ncbi:guanine deaminase [Agrobacterium larrymoorei]|uniref:Guanine deaminase n=1 Tax=Agrobacterium larrymoorei TaxID=160699 RepID=A0A4D7DIH1_9HYPH|nr:guanine deaminase [Agrobacterium larrymoorei]QCI97123.1 guanine deaminase [Agrobacterium larrymoorei]QYA07446.1 guanine deaminase [Agrobacterium larrymoorei]
MSMLLLRGRLLSFNRAPLSIDDTASYLFIEDGGLLISEGKIAAIGDYADIKAQAPEGTEEKDHRPHLIVPGLIDMHLHFPQMQVIGSYAANLLEWLNTYTFPEECRFVESAHAQRIATHFYDELIRHGTTTAVAYCSVHKTSADAFFAEAMKRNMLMVGGKVMMDRNAPQGLLDTPELGYDETRQVIADWHGKGRNHVAITPRFAITSTPKQMEAAQALAQEFPDLFIQTHLSENLDEIKYTCELYPEAIDYTDIYVRYGLMGKKTLLGHAIHLSDREADVLSETGAVAVHCPTSNLFIGSGLFPMKKLQRREKPVRIAVATDIGGGSSYSMLRTMDEAYKIQQLLGERLNPLESWYLMTRGNAEALSMVDRIGTLDAGTDADITVLNASSTPAMALKMEVVNSLTEELFLMLTMGDDRTVVETYISGKPAKSII